RAEVRVVPIQSGYSVEVSVFKELEDVPYASRSPVRMRTQRSDESEADGDIFQNQETIGWISKGRDVLLEQQILADLYGRVVGAEPSSLHL
ncbi:MAG: hypothetical protein WD070_03685, partial [Pirellulaceae bacterium]